MNVSKYDPIILKPEDELATWDDFVETSPQGSVFCRSWWLKAVCGDRFEILVLRRGDDIMGGIALPYMGQGKGKIYHHPELTGPLGVLLSPKLKDEKAKYTTTLTNEMELLTSLSLSIPEYNAIEMVCHPSFNNWMPFYWEEYTQTTKYTYRFDVLDDVEQIVSDFHHSKRKNIKKAKKIVRIAEDIPAEDFYQNHKMTLNKQGRVISYGFEYFNAIYTESYKNDSGKTFACFDDDGNMHAAYFTVYDRRCAYFLISTIDPEFRSLGASTYLMVHMLNYLQNKTERFDFEGSMIKGVEQSFRRYGAELTSYFVISKGNSLYPKIKKLVFRSLRKLGIKE